MLDLGATEHDFEIRINDRHLLKEVFNTCDLADDEERAIMRLLDKRNEMDDFDEKLAEAIGGERANKFKGGLSSVASSTHLEELLSLLYKLGITNAHIDTSIVRGFDYYTGMVFEVFDTAPENNRSLFGGGRYDNLLSMFDEEATPAVGFGMGDVTAHDFLEAHGLLPRYTPATELMLCVIEKEHTAHAMKLAQDLRREDVAVAVNLSAKKLGDQIRQADKMKIPFVIAVGAKERDTGRYTVKNLATGHEITLVADAISAHLFSSLG